MAELNHAYSSGDQAKLKKLSEDLRLGPEAIIGGTVGDALVRAIRQIAQIRRRLKELELEKAKSEASELFELYQKVEAEECRRARSSEAYGRAREDTHQKDRTSIGEFTRRNGRTGRTREGSLRPGYRRIPKNLDRVAGRRP
jgi:hypothetical protein